MPETYTVKPDREFLHRVLAEGGGDLKQCFQCATCSVVCELSAGKRPFPRKQMICAQWGLKDRLVADPSVWLCHQCNDCSTKCPRGARPADVMSALRQETIQHYAVPQALARLVNDVKFVPVMLLAAAVLLGLAWALKTPIWAAGEGVLKYLDHEGFYAWLYPHWLLIGFYSTFWGLAMLGAAVGVVRFWQGMKAADEAAGRYNPTLGFVPATVNVLKSIFTHDKFGKCTSQAARRTAHLGAFYGFAALFLVSVWAVVALYMINPVIPGHENDLHYPFAVWNPWKILANVGCIALIAGSALAIRDRMRDTKDKPASTPFDWIFVWLLLSVGITGLLTELLRYVAEPMESSGLNFIAYTIYFVHLTVVFYLLVYLPYSKFAHIVYRTVALIYNEHCGGSAGEAEKA